MKHDYQRSESFTAVAELIKRAHRHPGRIHWRHTVLAVEMAALVLASFAPVGE